MSEDWEPGRWWYLFTPDGKLWMETSDRHEAVKEHERTGYPLNRLFVRTERQICPVSESCHCSDCR